MSPVQHRRGPATAPPLLSLPDLALAAIFDMLPSYWRGDLRAACKHLQHKADALALRRVVVGGPGLLPLSGDDAAYRFQGSCASVSFGTMRCRSS